MTKGLYRELLRKQINFLGKTEKISYNMQF